MERADTVNFRDLTTRVRFWAYVRYSDDAVGLAFFNDWERLPSADRKEIEIYMGKEDARALLDALRRATAFEPSASDQVATVTFADVDTGEATSITVHHDARSVRLHLCNQDDGEVAVVMRLKDMQALIAALQTAVAL